MQFDSVGRDPFLAFQVVTDINYTTLLGFSEMEFVVPGPGARSGLRKCLHAFGWMTSKKLTPGIFPEVSSSESQLPAHLSRNPWLY